MAHSFFVRAQTGKIEFFLRFQTSQSTNVVAFCCFADGGIELFESVIKLQIEARLFVFSPHLTNQIFNLWLPITENQTWLESTLNIISINNNNILSVLPFYEQNR